MFGFNLKVPFPGNLINVSQLFMNYYHKGKNVDICNICQSWWLEKSPKIVEIISSYFKK